MRNHYVSRRGPLSKRNVAPIGVVRRECQRPQSRILSGSILHNDRSPRKRESALLLSTTTMSTTTNDSEEYYCFRVKETLFSKFSHYETIIIPRSYNFDLKKLRTELVSLLVSCQARTWLAELKSITRNKIFVVYLK